MMKLNIVSIVRTEIPKMRYYFTDYYRMMGIMAKNAIICSHANGFSPIDLLEKAARLIESKTIASISDKDKWEKINEESDVESCVRYPSLSRTKHYIDEHKFNYHYTDTARAMSLVHLSDKIGTGTCHDNIASSIIDKLYPISLPYMASNLKYYVDRTDFTYDEAVGDDTTKVNYVFDAIHGVRPYTAYFKRVVDEWQTVDGVNIYAKVSDWIEITKEEYEERLNGEKIESKPSATDKITLIEYDDRDDEFYFDAGIDDDY